MSIRLDKADRLAAYLGLRLTPDPDAVSPEPTPENLARRALAKIKGKRTQRGTQMNAKRKAVIERIKRQEDAIVKTREYLESGKHANWRMLRPLFDHKVRDGKNLPPHRDWVRNVFLRRVERALQRSERVLRTLERESIERAKKGYGPGSTLAD